LTAPRRWLFGSTALVFTAFAYFGLVQPALFPPRLEISDSVIDGYLISKGIPVSSAEAEALKQQFTRVSKDLEDLRARNPETGGQIAAAIDEFRKGSPEKAIINLEGLIEIIEGQRQKVTKDQATAEHALAALGYANDVAKAMPHYRNAAEMAPANVWFWIDYGRAARDSGDETAASGAFTNAATEAEKQGEERSQAATLTYLVSSLAANSKFDEAAKAALKALDITRRLARANPNNSDLSRMLSIGLEKVGDLGLARRDLDGALRAYEESLSISRRLFAFYPVHPGRARDLSIGLSKVGNAQLARHDIDGAAKSYEEALAIARVLMSGQPSDTSRESDVAAALIKVGTVFMARKDLSKALSIYQESLEISKRVLAADPNRADYAEDVSASLKMLAVIYVGRKDYGRALISYQERLGISRRLLAADKKNAKRAHQVAISLAEVGFALGLVGDKKAACTNLNDALAISEPLTRHSPDSRQMKEDIASFKVMFAATGCAP
jgi:tetratricopeptide (TPR) repeat protein